MCPEACKDHRNYYDSIHRILMRIKCEGWCKVYTISLLCLSHLRNIMK